MSVVIRDAELLLLEMADKVRYDSATWRCLHFHFSSLQPKNIKPERLNICANIIEKALFENKKTIFICLDGDIFVLCQGVSQHHIDRLVSDVCFLYADDPLIYGKNNSHIYTLYDLKTNYEIFIYACNRKLSAFKKHDEKQKIECEKEIHYSEINIDTNRFIKSLQQRNSREKLLVMVVEDHPFSRQLITHAISRKYDVIPAINGQEAIEQYGIYAPNIVFLDIEIPIVNGHQVLQKITELDSDSFVVMLTANSYEKDVKMAMRYGAKGFIAKPFTKQKMESYIQQYLDFSNKQ